MSEDHKGKKYVRFFWVELHASQKYFFSDQKQKKKELIE